jgi:hypothetical protein
MQTSQTKLRRGIEANEARQIQPVGGLLILTEHENLREPERTRVH